MISYSQSFYLNGSAKVQQTKAVCNRKTKTVYLRGYTVFHHVVSFALLVDLLVTFQSLIDSLFRISQISQLNDGTRKLAQ